MFEGLSSRFEGILRKVRGRGRLGPEDVEEFLAEIRVALLEADVHLASSGRCWIGSGTGRLASRWPAH